MTAAWRGGCPPEQIIEKNGTEGRITEDYCAHELDVVEGDTVELFKELNEWGWCRMASGQEYGWIPMRNLEPLARQSTGYFRVQ